MKDKLRELAILPFTALIRFYQICISPLKPSCCRFTPTCSQYALEAFRKYGPFKGFWLSLKRILRCHPWESVFVLHIMKASSMRRIRFLTDAKMYPFFCPGVVVFVVLSVV